MFEPIGNILNTNLKKGGLGPQFDRAQVFKRFSEKACGLLPEDAREAFRPLHVHRGVLTVACKSGGAIYALRKHQAELLNAIRDPEAGEPIKKIRFMLSSWR